MYMPQFGVLELATVHARQALCTSPNVLVVTTPLSGAIQLVATQSAEQCWLVIPHTPVLQFRKHALVLLMVSAAINSATALRVVNWDRDRNGPLHIVRYLLPDFATFVSIDCPG